MRRNGFTLVEIMVVVVVAGLMTLIGFPKIRAALVRSEVRAAASQVAATYASARANAIQTNRATTLNYAGNRVWITTVLPGGVLDTIGVVRHLDAAYGVTLSTTPADATITIDPRGIANGPAKFTITRAGVRDSVKIGNYGSVIR